MFRTLLTSTAIAALLSAGAIAQDAAPATPAPTEAPAAPATDAPATPAPADAPAAATAAPATGDSILATGYTVTDKDNLATEIIGKQVYSSSAADAEHIGDVNNLVIGETGDIAAVIIGVGGFLGIGEKAVAVPFNNITVIQAPDGGEVKLTTTETSESLQAAPEFKTLSQKVAEREQVDTSTTSSTDPAPATAPAE